MNVDGIEHVSYTIMDLKASPSKKYLLAGTDNNRHFIFQVGCNRVLRSFYGHAADAYGLPRVLWHVSEKYILSNSQGTGDIFVWEMASEKLIKQLSGHTINVRDLCCSSVGDTFSMYSVSYDKSIRVWK